MHEIKVISPEEARQAVHGRDQEYEARRLPYWLMAALVIVTTALLVVLIPPGRNGATIAGHELLIVVSGSMSPAIRTGDLVAVRSVDPATIAVGDVITFRDAAMPSMLITHRVIAITQGDHGPVFTTKGDDNPVPDKLPVAASQLVGKVQTRIAYGGRIVTFLRSPLGVLSLIVVPGLFVLFNGRRLLHMIFEESDAA